MLKNVYDKYNELDIPIDSLWNDIDYMKDYADFTIDTDRFDMDIMRAIYNVSD